MRYFTFIAIMLVTLACENKDINEGEEFRPRPVNDNFDDSRFAKVSVDGVEYLMMERDNNNPHEGFGFMAFRANKLMERQDSVYAYLKTMQFYQNKMYARMFNISEEEAQARFDWDFDRFLQMESKELEELEQESLTNEGEPSE